MPIALQYISYALPSALSSNSIRSIVNRGWGLDHIKGNYCFIHKNYNFIMYANEHEKNLSLESMARIHVDCSVDMFLLDSDYLHS